jgi:hypothetical protein
MMKPTKTSGATRFSGLYRSLGVSLGLPLVAIQVLLHAGVSPLIALAVATVFPLGEMVYEALHTKRVGVISIVSLAGILTGFGLSFATGNPVFALLKDSSFTCVFGLLFLGSLATSRPLIFRLNLELAGSDPAARAASEALWEKPAARRSFRLITLVWGLGLLAEAATRVVVALTLPIASAASVSPIIAVVVIGGLLLWTVRYARARSAAAAASASPTVAPG